MKKEPSMVPSAVVLSAARTIARDMKIGTEAIVEDLRDYAQMLGNMAKALKTTKENLEKYTMPLLKKRSKERQDMKSKISGINKAIARANRARGILELTIDDISETMDLKSSIPSSRYLDGIPGPSDEDLKRIEQEQEDNDGTEGTEGEEA